MMLWLLFVFVLSILTRSTSQDPPIRIGTYDDFISSCEHHGNISTIHQMTERALDQTNLTSTWLPIRRRDLNGWYWLSGRHYGFDVSLETENTFSMICGVIKAADRALGGANCDQTYSQYLCQDADAPDSPCTETKKLEKSCFQHNNKIYHLYNEHVNWYEARTKCRQENQYLASLDEHTLEDFLDILRNSTKTNSHIWVGLRNADYFIHNQQSASISEYHWRPNDICPCNSSHECVTIEKSKSAVYWKASNCSSFIRFVCLQKFQNGKQAPLAIIIGVAILLVLVIFLVVFIVWFLRYRKKSRANIEKSSKEEKEMKGDCKRRGREVSEDEARVLLGYNKRNPEAKCEEHEFYNIEEITKRKEFPQHKILEFEKMVREDSDITEDCFEWVVKDLNEMMNQKWTPRDLLPCHFGISAEQIEEIREKYGPWKLGIVGIYIWRGEMSATNAWLELKKIIEKSELRGWRLMESMTVK